MTTALRDLLISDPTLDSNLRRTQRISNPFSSAACLLPFHPSREKHPHPNRFNGSLRLNANIDSSRYTHAHQLPSQSTNSPSAAARQSQGLTKAHLSLTKKTVPWHPPNGPNRPLSPTASKQNKPFSKRSIGLKESRGRRCVRPPVRLSEEVCVSAMLSDSWPRRLLRFSVPVRFSLGSSRGFVFVG